MSAPIGTTSSPHSGKERLIGKTSHRSQVPTNRLSSPDRLCYRRPRFLVSCQYIALATRIGHCRNRFPGAMRLG